MPQLTFQSEGSLMYLEKNSWVSLGYPGQRVPIWTIYYEVG